MSGRVGRSTQTSARRVGGGVSASATSGATRYDCFSCCVGRLEVMDRAAVMT